MDETKSQGRQRERGHGEREDRGRWSTRRKLEIVLRILKGEDLDALAREVKLTAARLAQWRDAALAAMQAGLKSREADGHDLGARIGGSALAPPCPALVKRMRRAG